MGEAGGTSRKGWGAVGAGTGAAVVATAASACCVPILAPLIVSVLGVSGAVWAAGLKPFSPYILLAAGALLAWAFRTVYRPRPESGLFAEEGAACRRRPALNIRLVLWFAAAIWLVALALNVLQISARFL